MVPAPMFVSPPIIAYSALPRQIPAAAFSISTSKSFVILYRVFATLCYASGPTASHICFSVASCVSPSIINVFKSIAPDHESIKGITMSRKKLSEILNNVLKPVLAENLVKNLQESKFSPHIHQTVDVSNNKLMIVITRYVDSVTGKVKNEILELLELNADNCDTDNLYQALKELLKRHKIKIDNILSLNSGNASVMIGTVRVPLSCPRCHRRLCDHSL